MQHRKLVSTLLLSAILATGNAAGQSSNRITIIGAMKDVMWKGELSGKIDLDTIGNRTQLYGLGPVEGLSGEILILDGKGYKSTVVSGSEMAVEETYRMRAPFFGYAHIARWTEHNLPDSVQTIQQLEQYLERITLSSPRPFLFRLAGVVEQATIHIVNLPKGAKVNSPQEAHRGQVSYELHNEASDILGFFSTAHQAVFTHHDTFLHMHLITADKKKMGHLDKVVLRKGEMKLYLPSE